jgi:outer membrane protein OmpA-like peptidoglycan-associated protein/tetratricopeptide (TPR) repeat protein
MRTLWIVLMGVVVLGLAMPHEATAQRKKKKKGSTSLEKTLTQADQLYKASRMTEADKLYRAALKQDPTNQQVLYRIGAVNSFLGKHEEAIKWTQAAIDIDPNKNDTLWFNLGRELKITEDYAESTRAFERFIELHQRNDYLLRQARLELESNQFAIAELAKPAGWEIERLSINSKNTDLDPTVFSVDGKRYLVFTSHRAGSIGKAVYSEFGSEPYCDLWIAPMTSDYTFGSPQNMGKMINTEANDGAAVVTADGSMMYYSIASKGKVRKTFGASIYQAAFDATKKKWNHFELVEGINSTREEVVDSRGRTKKVPTYDAHPALSLDGNTMYFVSDRQGGLGETDIWYSTRAGNKWNTPLHAGRVINTEFLEWQPYVGPDGALYFASDGHKGMGGLDLYRTTGAEGLWEAPVNLGHPLNTSYNDYTILFLTDTTGYITSDRPGGAGRDDIYAFTKLRPVPVKPVVVSIQGRVRDQKTRQIIPFSTVSLYRVEPGNNFVALDTFKTDQTGQYKFALERGKDYRLVGTAPEYLANEVFVSTKTIDKTTTLEADIDISLERIELNRPIVLQNIYYDFDKADLRIESLNELDKLVALMVDNPGLTIQMGSHTDTNGPEGYNIALSKRRALSVVNYLTEKGVAKKRITWLGFGESQPLIYPEMSDEDEQANRRSEFRIQAFDVVVEVKGTKGK